MELPEEMEAEVERLSRDPIIAAMCAELMVQALRRKESPTKMMQANGPEVFRSVCCQEYRVRGGKNATHTGTPGIAIERHVRIMEREAMRSMREQLEELLDALDQWDGDDD